MAIQSSSNGNGSKNGRAKVTKPTSFQDFATASANIEQPYFDMAILDGCDENRPWGGFKTLVERDNYKVKQIIVLPNHRLSLQRHRHRSEHWTVVTGTATVQVGNENFDLPVGKSCFIEACEVHRLSNEGKIPLIIIEVQTGEYLGEDDIIRYQDDYNRA
jgi:mannose-6-phosphate isomerase